MTRQQEILINKMLRQVYRRIDAKRRAKIIALWIFSISLYGIAVYLIAKG